MPVADNAFGTTRHAQRHAPPSVAASSARTHVFLSNAQWSGGDQCLLLRDALCAQGLRVWLDQDNEPTASDMEEGIAGAGCVALFLSSAYFSRPAVQREVKKALELRKPVLLVHDAAAPWGAALEAIVAGARAYASDACGRAKDAEEGRPFLTLAEVEGPEGLFAAGGGVHRELDCFAYAAGEGMGSLVERLAGRIREVVPPAWTVGEPAAHAAFKLRRQPKALGGSHLLLAAGAKGQRQLHYLQSTLHARCPTLRVSLLECGVGAAGAAGAGSALSAASAAAQALAAAARLASEEVTAAWGSLGGAASAAMAGMLRGQAGGVPALVAEARQLADSLSAAAQAGSPGDVQAEQQGRQEAQRADYLLVLLTEDVFEAPAVRGALGAALEWPADSKRLLLRHEPDAWRGGAQDFGAYFSLIPRALRGALEVEVSRPFQRRRREREIMVEEVLQRVGAFQVAEGGRLAPPTLPLAFSAEAVSEALEGVVASLEEAGEGAARAVIVGGQGGLGKSVIATEAARRVAAAGGRFSDLLWVTVGRGGRDGEMRAALTGLLEELGESVGEKSATLDQLADWVRGALEKEGRGAVLVVIDDLAEGGGGYTPHFSTLARAVPRVGASRVLITTREVGACARVVGSALAPACGAAVVTPFGRGKVVEGLCAADGITVVSFSWGRLCTRLPLPVAAHELAPLSLPKAAGLIRSTVGAAKLKSVDDLVLEVLADATGRSPFALQIAAGSLRAMLEQPNVEGVEDAARAGACAAALSQQMRETPLPPSLGQDAMYAPVYRAIAITLQTSLTPSDAAKFSTFAIFEEDAEVPAEVLGAAWAVEGGARLGAVIQALEDAALLKRGREGCVQLHDLAWEYARAVGRAVEAHGNAVDRWREMLSVGGAWWVVREGVGKEARAYVGAQLLRHLREAGRGEAGTELVWRLEWLMSGVREWGGAVLARQVAAQLAWEQAQGSVRAEEAKEMRLLHHMLVMMVGEGILGVDEADGVPAQVIGRLGAREIETGLGGARVAALVEQAMAWDGGRKAWLRPVRPNFPLPGGACVAVMAGHTEGVNSVCSLGDGRVVSASEDGTLRVWDSATGECLRVLKGHSREVRCVCALENGRIASGSADRRLKVWDATTGACLWTVTTYSNAVSCVCSLPRGLLAFGVGYCVGVVNAETGKLVRILEGHTDFVRCVCKLGDERIASGSNDKTLRVWNVESRECVVLEGHEGWVHSVCALRDGRLVSGSSGGELKVWDAALSGECAMLRAFKMQLVASLCVLEDGRVVSGSGSDTTWNPNRELINTCRLFSPPPTLAEGGAADLEVQGREGTDGGMVEPVFELELALEGHMDTVNSVCALGRECFVSGSADGTVRLWNPAFGVSVWQRARVRALEPPVEGHYRSVDCVRVLQDGVIECETRDNMVFRWSASTGACLEKGWSTLPERQQLPDGDAVCISDVQCDMQHTSARFAPWGAFPVYLGEKVEHCVLTTLPSGRRFATAFTISGAVHTQELIEPAALPELGGGI